MEKSTLTLLFASALSLSCPALFGATLMDNTSGLTETAANNSGANLSQVSWMAISFTTGSDALELSSVTIPLSMAFGGSGNREVSVALYYADSFAPTDTALDTSSETVSLTGSAVYYSFDLSQMDLSAGTRYALVFSSNEASDAFPFMMWGEINERNGTNSVSVGSEIDTVAVAYSGDSGESWSPVGNISGIQLIGSTIPEPSAAALLGSLLIPMLTVRRRSISK